MTRSSGSHEGKHTRDVPPPSRLARQGEGGGTYGLLHWREGCGN
jgi:hypothetical protein